MEGLKSLRREKRLRSDGMHAKGLVYMQIKVGRLYMQIKVGSKSDIVLPLPSCTREGRVLPVKSIYSRGFLPGHVEKPQTVPTPEFTKSRGSPQQPGSP